MTGTIQYPNTPREEIVEEFHGVKVSDPYRWLEDDHSPETEAWVTAQNQLTFSFLKQIPAREKIRQRMTELWNFEKFGIPFKKGGRYFFTRNDGLQNQSPLYWLENLADEPRLLIDPNQLSADGTVALVNAAINRDGTRLAYGISGAGSDWQEIHLRPVGGPGSDLPDMIRWVKFSGISWTADGKGFYYCRYDEPAPGSDYKSQNYFHKLYYHRLGEPQEGDRLVYERPDQKEWLFYGEVSNDGRYLVITVSVGTQQANAILYQDLAASGSEVTPLLTGFDAEYIFLGNDGPRFYFRTDKGAPLGRVVSVDIQQPGEDALQGLVPEAGDTLQFASIVGDQMFLAYLHDAHSQVKVYSLNGALHGEVGLPGIGSAVGFTGSREDRETFYLFTSFTDPGSIYHYDLESGKSTLFRQPRTSFSPQDYVTEQVFYNSKDGTRVPMFLVHKPGLRRDGNNPTILYGYGGFNIPVTPAFSVLYLVWMEMGGLVAVANLRGGSEYGKAWHEAGMKLNKQNVFDDFIAAAEWLIANRYTRRPKLAILGRSNGGLLVGACLTQRPDLYGACIPVVGVLDMLRFHKWTIGWAWVSDYGSVEEPDEFRALLAYSPYHNIRPGMKYPPTLVTTGDHDDRVFPAHSFKFAAALQAAQSGEDPVLIRIDVRAGHGLGKPTAKLIEEASDQLAFLVKFLDVQA
jgi:prolyl oligopeptidase